jgi:3(or 17)beta-hydroxysteroid dehydrogenase
VTRLTGKVAIVTGATGSLGRAFALALAAEGANVVATGRNVDRGEETVALIRHAGGMATFLHHDVTDEAAWGSVTAQALKMFGRLDALINNAGDAVLKPIDQITLEDLRYLLRLNVEGPFFGIQAAMAAMGKAGGSIVNVTVLSALAGNANSTAYSAAKGGLAHLTRAAALAGAPRKIRVNAIVPGVLFDGGELSEGAIRVHGGPEGARRFKERILAKTPLRRLGEPVDAARAAVFLCSDEAQHLTGVDIVVDGGRVAGPY